MRTTEPHRKGEKLNQHKPHGFWGAFARGLLVTAMVIAINHRIEETATGQWLLRTSYEFLQFRLRVQHPASGLDLEERARWPVLLNIHDLVRPHEITNRQNLAEILSALRDAGATAVAIDIDFTPEAVGQDSQPMLTEAEREFFDFCVKQSNEGFPIFLGMHRGMRQNSLQRDKWFLHADAGRLAVHVAVPARSGFAHGEHGSDVSASPGEGGAAMVRTMPLQIQIEPDGDPLPSLAQALATAPGKDGQLRPLPAVPWLFQPFIKPYTDTIAVPLGGDRRRWLKTRYFPVNFGALEILLSEAVDAPNAREVTRNAEAFRGRPVIMGSLDLRHDLPRHVPDRDTGVPGCAVHACAAWTLGAAPIYALTPTGRLAIDFALAGVVLIGVLLLGPWLGRRGFPGSASWLHRSMPWIVCGVAFLLGVFFIRMTRVLWDDFVFVLAGLLIFHTTLETGFERIIHWARRFSKRRHSTVGIALAALAFMDFVPNAADAAEAAPAGKDEAAPPKTGAVSIGIVKNVIPPVSVKSPPDVRAFGLTPSAKGRHVFAGESFEAEAGGRVELQLGDGLHEVVGPKKFVVEPPKTPPNDPVWNAYSALFDGAAVPRAGRGNVSEPVADTFVRPSTFRVRWNPRAWSGNLAVELLDHKGTRIWHADRVPASDGKISAEAARDALSKAQDGKYSRNGILVITERSGTEKRISFRILSSDDSASVDRDLAAVDTACKNAEWLRHAARAGILLKRGLIGEATDEAAHAAELAPAGAPVRATAVKLLEAAGESARAKQLAEPAR